MQRIWLRGGCVEAGRAIGSGAAQERGIRGCQLLPLAVWRPGASAVSCFQVVLSTQVTGQYLLTHARERPGLARNLSWPVTQMSCLKTNGVCMQAFDAVLSVFAPCPAAEIRRVLRPGGALVRFLWI